MALVLQTIYNFWLESIEEHADHTLDDWFFVKSPIPTVIIVVIYMYAINIGTKLMRNVKPYNIDKILIAYNIFQVAASVTIAYKLMFYAVYKYNFWCHSIDHSADGLVPAKYIWCYFFLKIIDLLDTVFFVLRKKQNQISFLHLYHHAGMVMVGWVGVRFVPGGSSIYIAIYNSIVHTVMYSYYLLTVWDKGFKQSIWWKKHLTQLQIMQFATIILHYAPMLFLNNCDFPKWAPALLVPQAFFITALFVDFYIRTYIQTAGTSRHDHIKQ